MEHKVPDDQQILEEYFNLATNKKTKKLSWLYGMVATFGLDPDQLNGFTWNKDYSINLKNRIRRYLRVRIWLILTKIFQKNEKLRKLFLGTILGLMRES